MSRMFIAPPALTPQGASEPATGTTSSTSFTATLGGSPGTNPSVTLVTGTSVKISVTAQISAGVNYGFVGVAVSGATTIAASTANAAGHGAVAIEAVDSRTFILTGLTPGSNTFTLQYVMSAGTGTFLNRSLVVTPI